MYVRVATLIILNEIPCRSRDKSIIQPWEASPYSKFAAVCISSAVRRMKKYGTHRVKNPIKGDVMIEPTLKTATVRE